MTFEVSLLPGINITLAYDALPLERINRDQLRKSLNDPQVVVMDTPDLIVAIAPTRGLLVQVGDRRIRIIDQKQTAPHKTELAALAAKLHASVAGSALLAYGFNYDLSLKAQGTQSPAQILKARFLPDEERLAALVQGPIEIMAPRLIFQRRQARYDLVFQPDDDRLKAHVNVHYEGGTLPDGVRLQAALDSEAQDMIALLASLFPKD